MSKIAAIGRVGLVSIFAIIIVIAVVGVYAYTDTSQMTTAQTTSSSVSTTSSLSENLSGTSNSSAVSNSEWHFEAIVSQNESGIVVQSNLTSIINRTRTAIFGDPIVTVVVKQLNGTVVYSPVITALARIVNVSFGQSFLTTQQIQVALQPHETYNFVITPQVGDNSTSGAPGVSIEFTPLFSETTATVSNLDTVAHTVTTSTTSSTAFSNSCSTSYFNGTDVVSTMFLSQKTGSSVNLCVRFYYYNSTSTDTILPLQQLTMYSVVPSNGTLGNANSLFSISATTPQFQIGGPQSENEGFAVNYTISATLFDP